MPNSPIDVLLGAIKARWHRDNQEVAEHHLIRLGRADVDRPPALVSTLELRRGQSIMAVIGIADLSALALDERTFQEARDLLRQLAHYLSSHINPRTLSDDAHLWAVGPLGSDSEEAWQRLRIEVHQDTWSVPKSVWLPGTNSDPESFLDEGLLATPWQGVHGKDADTVDIMERFAVRLGTRAAPWSRQQVRALLNELTNCETNPAEAAERLIRLAEDS